MRALVVEPGVPGSTQVAEVPDLAPGAHEVLLRALEVGVCGTDREISHGLFGVAPDGERRLILGHEFLGTVERAAHGFARGDLVTATVRRSCRHCPACLAGAPDACLTGDYLERGITRLDGFASELVTEAPGNLVAIQPSLRRIGVLAEPASICARGLRLLDAIGRRQPWAPTRALVVGTGAIGMIATFLLRLRDFEVWTAGVQPGGSLQATLIEAAGARYVSASDTPLAGLAGDLAGFDVVVVAAGDAQLMLDSLSFLRRNGVVCLLGIDGREQAVSLDGTVIGVEMILANRAVFGSVNANRVDWVAAIEQLEAANRRWPQALAACVGLRVGLERFEDAFAFTGVKATLQLS